MVLNDLVDSFCYSQKNAGLKGLIVVRECSAVHSLSTKLPLQLAKHNKLTDMFSMSVQMCIQYPNFGVLDPG